MSWQDEVADDDGRTTGYVIETLGEDVDKAFKRLSKNFDEIGPDGAENVKFSFRLTDKAHGRKTPTLDTSRQWWSDFKEATRIRDRLMHPRLPRDLNISPDEVVLIMRVEFGFRELMGSYIDKPDHQLPN